LGILPKLSRFEQVRTPRVLTPTTAQAVCRAFGPPIRLLRSVVSPSADLFSALLPKSEPVIKELKQA